MAVLGLKSIPLMRGTNIAWKTVPGFWFVDRKRDPNSIVRHVNSRNYEAIINLGRVDVDDGRIVSPVFNEVNTIKAVSTPRALRRILNDFLPVSTHISRHWHKSRGFAGVGKQFFGGEVSVCGKYNGETQYHIDGTEYRIITVGDSIVQASRKTGKHIRRGGLNEFKYEWVGVDGIRKGGFIPTLKEAVVCVPGWERTVFGWDVIHDGERPWIIEANTCPGVNDATARRVVDAVRERV